MTIHQVLGAVSGQTSDILIHAENIRRTREKMNFFLASLTGRSVDEIAADTERDCIMSAKEALDYGIIDKVGDPFCEQ